MRFRVAFLLVALGSLALFPPAWHGALRAFIAWQASARGWTIRIGELEGGLLDATVLYDVQCHKKFPAPTATEQPGGVDLAIARSEAVFSWHWPWGNQDGKGWLDRVTLDGLTGTLDFTSAGAGEASNGRAAAGPPQTADLTPGFIVKLWPLITAPPASFDLLRVNCQVARGATSLRLSGTRLTAHRDEAGQFVARQLAIAGPGFENTLDNRSGVTNWRAGKLTLSDLSLGRGLDLVRLTVDTARLRKRQLDWDSELHALGGSVRGQGTVRFAHGRISLDVAGSFQQVAMRPLARMLGIAGETDGTVDQGQFTFRGNPEQWTQATISLAGQATDFRWRQRRWESLDLAAIVLHERLTVRKLELRQSRNQLSVSGECPLVFSGGDRAWKLAGFTCQIDAKLDDLHSLAQLLGNGLPDMAGRMSVNGSLTSRSDGPGLDGYLNVEGSALTVSKAPLDYLRSTLLFKGEELKVADIQATRGKDSLSGKGSVSIFGGLRYQGELKASIADLAVYHPAYAGALSTEPLRGMLNVTWSGDGAPGAHSGAFHGSVADFVAKSGPAQFSRPITLEADGTYSPESLSFRQLALKDGPADKRRDAIRFEGALPWTRDSAAWAAGRWLDFSKPLAVRMSFNEAPLDLIAEAGKFPGLESAKGQVGGWLDVSGTPEAPKADGVLQFRNTDLHLDHSPAIEKATADVRIEDSVARFDQMTGQRDGATWQVGGSVDLHHPAAPMLDVTLKSPRVPGAIHTRLVHGDCELDLTVRGLMESAEIAGEVRLINTTMDHWLRLGTGYDIRWRLLLYLDAPSFNSELPPLPREWRTCKVALHVTAPKPLRGPMGGEFNPDFLIAGVGSDTVITGQLGLSKVSLFSPTQELLTVETGAVYFDAQSIPSLNASLKGGGTLIGPLNNIQRIPAKQDSASLAELWQRAERLGPDEMWGEDVRQAPEPTEPPRLSLNWGDLQLTTSGE